MIVVPAATGEADHVPLTKTKTLELEKLGTQVVWAAALVMRVAASPRMMERRGIIIGAVLGVGGGAGDVDRCERLRLYTTKKSGPEAWHL